MKSTPPRDWLIERTSMLHKWETIRVTYTNSSIFLVFPQNMISSVTIWTGLPDYFQTSCDNSSLNSANRQLPVLPPSDYVQLLCVLLKHLHY